MSKGKKKKNRPPADVVPARDDGEGPGLRSREDVAREIGASTGPKERSDAKDALGEEGPLRLDKSGALMGRPKLKPIKAHRKGEDGTAPDGTAPEEASRQGTGEDGDRTALARPPPNRPEEAGQRETSAGAARPDAASETLKKAGATGASAKRTTGGPRKASLPPRIGTLRPEGAAAAAARAADEIEIPAGSFLFGETQVTRVVPAYHIDRKPVTNGDYETFVVATGHRPPLYWGGPVSPEALVDHPVVGVDYYDALAYARWKGKDLPFEDEWERAARGTDGRTYPWGNDQELSGANTARVGLRMTVPSDLHKENVSPDGCLDMVGNAWEITHTPAPGGGVVVRGGSWYDFALYAKTFFRFASRPDARNGTIGFRCCRREEERSEEPREVSHEEADAEIAARRGHEAPVDRSEWSVERRDLVLDLPRLRTFVAEARAEALLGAARVRPERGLKPAPVPRLARPATLEPDREPDQGPDQEESAQDESAQKAAALPDAPSGVPAPSPDVGRDTSVETGSQAQDEAQDETRQPLVVPPPEVGAGRDGPDESGGPGQVDTDAAPLAGEQRETPAPPTGAEPDARPEAESEAEAREAAAEVEPPEPELPRIHVGGGPSEPPLGAAAKERDADEAMAWQQATEQAVQGETVAAARSSGMSRSAQSMPLTMWVLLAAGFLLFGGLLVVLVNQGESSDEPETEPPPVVVIPEAPEPAVRSPLADLPDMPDYDAFPWASEPAQIRDGAGREAAAEIDKGTWLLVFVDPEAAEAEPTLRAAHAMHRRLATHDVRVAVVLPRARYENESGALEEAARVADRVKADGRSWLWDGIPVLLDPADGRGRGLLRLRCGVVEQGVSTVLLHDGVLESRTTAPPGGYTEVSLVRIARRALEFARGE